MFVDEVVMSLKAGNGGDGCMSFRREKFIPKGGPNGGDGGNGGNIVLRGNPNVTDLTDHRFKPIAKAQSGQPGRGNDRHGRKGADCVIKLPPGTVVYSTITGRVVTDITEPNQKIVLLRGGRGGRGNAHFKSSSNRAPRETTPGTPGEEGQFRFVLKTIADVGLVGFPNAGKSSLTNLITRAHPKTAPYPFTTLRPQVGIIEYPQEYERIHLADIPGLIQGASENRGLGHRFLRHIERCRLLLFILDMGGFEGRTPWDDYTQLIEELRLYDATLLEKPRFVAANKMDLPSACDNLKIFHSKHTIALQPISCLTQEGLPELKATLLNKVLTYKTESNDRSKDASVPQH